MIAARSTSLARCRRPARRQAFTLVEVMIATAVGAVVLAAIASIIVMSARIAYKNREIDASATNTRLVQEHLNNEMSIAISQTSPVDIRPQYSLPSDTTPVRYGRVAYRVQVGSFSTLLATTVKTSDTLVIDCPADVSPKVNDYVLMDNPSLGSGIRITGVSPENSTGGTVTLTLETSIAAGTVGDQSDPQAGVLVRIQRQRAYETAEPDPTDNPVTELRWYETWYEPDAADTPYLVLSRNVDSSARYLFAQVPEEPATPDPSIEPAVSWQFSYVSEGNGALLPGARAVYYQTNYAEGLIMPKSGNPLNTTSILGGGSSTTSTTSTTSSSTTSYTTTSTTTSVSTTSTTSSTTSFTTTTSTTSVSTTSTTTSFTTTSSTTSVSTSSTTSVSTSSTSTSYTTTTSTTSVSTSSTSTSASTTSSSTSVSTSSTTTSATTTSSSISSSSTTTSATTSSTSTSVSTTSTTSSIPFDG